MKKILSPKLDIVFHMLFGEQKHERITKKLVEDVIGEKDLNRSISIIFLDYKLEKLKELPIHTKWQIKESENAGIILTEDLEIHIIELPKIKEKIEEGSLKKWILFLENPEGEETKKIAIAKRMKKENIPNETIEKLIGLTREIIENL